MKSTEVFIEQVIIGVVVLLIACLPFAPELAASWPGDENGAGAVVQATVLALMVGAAYLLGIVFDRSIDTLLQRLDRQNRLRSGLSKFKSVPRKWKDPFPEGDYKMAALALGGAVTEWLNYLRSRIRLSRAMAALLPGLTASAVVAARRLDPRVMFIEALFLVAVYTVVAVGLIYLLAFVLVVGLDRRLRSAPPTNADRDEVVAYGERRGYFKEEVEGSRERRRSLALDLASDPAVWGAAVLLLSSFWLAYHLTVECKALWAIPFLGTALTALSGWSWWRISQTYRKDLRRAFRARQKAAAAKASS